MWHKKLKLLHKIVHRNNVTQVGNATKYRHAETWLETICYAHIYLCSISSFQPWLAENLRQHTHTRLTAHCPGLPGWASTRKVKPIWILLKQETLSGNGISWAICKSAHHSREITMPAPNHSDFYRPDVQPTASKHWRHKTYDNKNINIF